MDSSTLSTLRQDSDSANKIGSSDPDITDRILDLESGTFQELNKPAPGTWRFPTNPDLCCIYRVPSCLREVNPKAYTPQLVLIGPLYYSLKSQALKSRGDITDAKSMGYSNMETHKKIYLAEFARRVEGSKTIDRFRRMIEEEEDMIRASYSESKAWIESKEFVDMILHDSVFILELILRTSEIMGVKIGDPIIDERCLEITIKRDLILLENQLPYFILEKLFDPIVPRLRKDQTLRGLIISHFKVVGIEDTSRFSHFTDLLRCVRVETVPDHAFGQYKRIKHLPNADKLDSRGVKFEVIRDKLSVMVKFDKESGCLKIPRFIADDESEITLRNVMALEQCHYPYEAHVCDYIMFMDFLIDTKQDVDLLAEIGIITNRLGDYGAVAKMVNKLRLGILDYGSYHTEIASDVRNHYENKCNKARAILRRVYFSHLWRGTATVTAALLLVLTLIQTVTSIIDVV